jgi:signal transduction histidine kinase
VEKVVLGAVEEIMEQAAQASLTINARIERGLPKVPGDAGGLSRAVGALLDNAVKFSPNGGEIGVRVRAMDGTLRVEISDPGVGLPMEQVDDVFEPFTRIEATAGHLFGGVGLGLPIAKQVVESHGGHIKVESEVGKGSTFTIVLPVTKEAAG